MVSWWRAKNPVVRFLVGSVIVMSVLQVALATGFVKHRAIPAYQRLCASMSAGVIGLFGEDITANGPALASPRFSVNIKKGCDAIQPTALLVAAVLASPVPLRRRLWGASVGTLFLAAMNLVRVISLFYIGIYWPNAFDMMHFEVWQAVFIFLAIAAWGLWAFWAARPDVPARPAHKQAASHEVG
ncbi:MAG: exosortase H [Phycisphaerae bacterium]